MKCIENIIIQNNYYYNSGLKKYILLTFISFFATLHASPNPTTNGVGTVPLLKPRS